LTADRLTGGEAVVESLIAHGIDTVFGLPGAQLDPVFAALHDRQDRIRTIHARHEQGAGYMAWGYAEAGGRMGTLLVVPGPGLLNAASAVATAHARNAPLLCLSGQGRSPLIDRGYGVLHEIPDQLATARTLFRSAEPVRQTADIPAAIAAAVAAAMGATGGRRCGPAYLELPLDLTQAGHHFGEFPLARGHAVPAADESLVEQTAASLIAAACPLIIAGGGATAAGGALCELAELLGSPVAMTANGLGTLDGRHRLAFTPSGAYHWWQRADRVLAVGTRLFPAALNWGTDDSMSIIKVDTDRDELTRLPCPLTAVEADAGEFLARVTEQVRSRMRRPVPDRSDAFAAVRAAVERDLAPLAPQRELLAVIRDVLGEEGVLVSDLTQLHYVAPDAYPVYRSRSFIHASYQGTLGHAAATGVGAQVAVRDRPVVVLAGDGGFLYTMHEMSTAVRFGVPVTWVVMNDGAYGNVKRMLTEDYGGRALGVDLSNPDFVRLAESFGIPGRRASTPGVFRKVLAEAVATDGPALVEYVTPEFPSPWPLYFRPQIRGTATARQG